MVPILFGNLEPQWLMIKMVYSILQQCKPVCKVSIETITFRFRDIRNMSHNILVYHGKISKTTINKIS